MRIVARRISLAVLYLLLVLVLPSSVVAAPGSLDPLFGGTGTLTTGIAPGGNFDMITELGIQPDGKIVAAGYANMGAGAGGQQFVLARYNTDGSLDTGFGTGGKVTTGIAPADNNDAIIALGIQTNGKIVTAGYADMGAGAGGTQFAVARYNADGSLDTGFDTDGKLTMGIAPADAVDVFMALGIQTNGKIVAAGYALMGGGAGGTQFAVARYNEDGSLDAGFDGDGKLTTGIAPPDNEDSISALGIQTNGKIVVAGYAYMGEGAGNYQAAYARYNTDGSLDAGFDGDGMLTTGIAPADNDDFASSLSIQPDGKIVSGGYADMGAGAGGRQFALARYNTDGTLDTGFDSDGKLTTGIAPADNAELISALGIQPDGKIVAAGYAVMGTGGYQFALARYHTGGSLDTSFGSDGKLTTGIAPADNADQINSLGIQPDGKIVAGGYADMGGGAGGRQFALARYNGLIPDTAITAGPAELATITGNTPTFEFSSTPAGASFQCSLDGGPYSACASPYTTSALTNAPHSFSVRATDSVGDPDTSPATRFFAVATPVIPDTTAPIADTTAPRITLSGRSTRRLGRARSVVLTLISDEDCTLKVAARIVFNKARKAIKLAPVTVKATAGKQAQIRFKLSKKKLAALKRAFKARSKASLRATATAIDAAGNAGSTNLTLKLKP